MARLVRKLGHLLAWLFAALLVLGLCCCAGTDAPSCPPEEDFRAWSATSGPGVPPTLTLGVNACGARTALTVHFEAAGTLRLNRQLHPGSLTLTLDNKCQRAGYSIASLHGPAWPGLAVYQAAVSGSTDVQIRADEPCEVAARISLHPLR